MSSNTKPQATDARADAKKDAAQDEQASQPKKYEVGRKLGAFKRKLNAYTRVKERSLAALRGEKVEKQGDSSGA